MVLMEMKRRPRMLTLRRWMQFSFFIAFFVVSAFVLQRNVRCAGQKSEMEKVRLAGVAGSFYPADPAALTAMMDAMLAKVPPRTLDGPVLAVIAPHAGYEYSGPVAAYTYAALRGRSYSRVVVIAPSHYEAFDFTSVYDGDAYRTPLGDVPVDKSFAQQLVRADASLRLSSRGHTPTAQGAEHALEDQLPWLQHVLGQFTLVPVVMGNQSYENSRALGLALARMIKGSDTLIVASSDLSHYHPYDEAVKIDRKTLDAIQAWDYLSMSRNFESRVWEACGGAPIVAAMIAAERMGANQAKLLKYANSGDVTGDKSRVVGYSAWALLKAPHAQVVDQPFTLSEQDKRELLNLARLSVEHAVREKSAYEPAASDSEMLSQERGAFVTLKIHGELRGCIGYTSAIKPLYQTVRDTATYAALQDPRFAPVSKDELPKLQYEVSVLSPLRRVLNTQEIVVGQHGLLMKNDGAEGILLPQVPVEEHWDRDTFLEQTCRKAGMNSNCWKDENTDIFQFTAVVFNEQKK
jgi:AmmeMemoRadiSam system protein B/AmmeMemoRadiSam system protein A